MSAEGDPELDRILRVLNEDAELAEDVERRVWDRVRGRRDVRRRNVAVAVAAAVLVVVGALSVRSNVGDDAADVVTGPVNGVDALEPCEVFRVDGRSPQTLRTLLLAGAVDAGEIGDSADAIEDLRDALAADGEVNDGGGPIDRDLQTIAGALRQAEASLTDGDRAAALRALDFAASRYERSELATSSCLG